MSAVQMIVTPAYLDRINNDFWLKDIIHESAYDAFSMHSVDFDLSVVHTLIAKIEASLADECDTALTPEGDLYYLVPITNEKVAA